MEIDPNDYITDEQKREICEDAFREQVRRTARADFERILSNAGYAIVHKAVDEAFDNKMAETVKDKAIEVIEGISAGTVFRAPNAWEKEPSVAYTHLQAAMAQARPAVIARVQEIVAAISEDRLRDMIESSIADAIIEKLRR